MRVWAEREGGISTVCGDVGSLEARVIEIGRSDGSHTMSRQRRMGMRRGSG
jgi:hypothetical protein